MERSEADLIAAVVAGDAGCFEPLVAKYSPRLFATARRYARRESEVEDIVQEIWLKVYQRLHTFRGEAPFEHWLMRTAVRTCYDFLRAHQRSREQTFSDLSDSPEVFVETTAVEAGSGEDVKAIRQLLNAVLDRLSPPARLIITLLEIEDRSVKEIARLTGWSVAGVKVRAFRARAEMRKIMATIAKEKFL